MQGGCCGWLLGLRAQLDEVQNGLWCGTLFPRVSESSRHGFRELGCRCLHLVGSMVQDEGQAQCQGVTEYHRDTQRSVSCVPGLDNR